MLRRSAAIVEGTVQKIAYTYDDQRGPRTVSTFAIDDVYFGDSPGDSVELPMFGGPIPDGRFASSSLGSEFVEGGRYVLFLTNSRWSDTPLEAPALRIGVLGEREVLTDEAGYALTGLGPDGMSFSSRNLAQTANDVAASKRVPVAVGTLDRTEFKRLLTEAVADERATPSGKFSVAPTMPTNDWRVSPGAPPAQAPTRTSTLSSSHEAK